MRISKFRTLQRVTSLLPITISAYHNNRVQRANEHLTVEFSLSLNDGQVL